MIDFLIKFYISVANDDLKGGIFTNNNTIILPTRESSVCKERQRTYYIL